MANEFVVKNGFHSKDDSQVTGSLDVSGVLTAGGSVVGAAFPFTGDAQITGSLIVSGSTSPALRIQNSGSTILEVRGSTTMKFDVNDVGNNTSYTSPNIQIGPAASAGGTIRVFDDGGIGSYHTGTYPGLHLRSGTGKFWFFNDTTGGTGNTIYCGEATTIRDFERLSFDRNTVVYIDHIAVNGTDDVLHIQTGDTSNDPINRLTFGNYASKTGLYFENLTGIAINKNIGYAVAPNAMLDISGSVLISGSLTVSGSNTFTNIGPAEFIGDTTMTGSLTISGSFHSFTLDSDNIVLGAGAGTAMLAAASNNVILGTDAGAALTTGVQNVFIGDQAGNNGDTEIANILIGYKAGYNFGSGARSSYNICIGNSVASSGNGADGKYNIFMGYQSGNTLTSGDFNCGYGHQSLMGIIGGVNNIALGYSAGGSINSGDSNINIGYWAGKNQTTGDGNITMGSGSLGVAGESQQLRIGNGNSLVTISASLSTGETIVKSQRPITTHTVDFTASMDYIGEYNRVGGNLTCSILPTATYAVAMGAEFDFFQTSSAGYMLISGSGVTINSKNNNFNLAGQFSSATLKKVGSDEWDLMGDLT